MRMTLYTVWTAMALLIAGPSKAAINYIVDVTLPVNYYIENGRLAAAGEASFPQVVLEPGPGPYEGDTATINASFTQPMIAEGPLYFTLIYRRDGPAYPYFIYVESPLEGFSISLSSPYCCVSATLNSLSGVIQTDAITR